MRPEAQTFVRQLLAFLALCLVPLVCYYATRILS